MKWLIKLIDWFLRETLWRRYYKRVTFDEKKQLVVVDVWFAMLGLQVTKVLVAI